MHAYRDQYAQIFRSGQNVVLIGISVDSAGALASWAKDDQFQFLMGSDTDQAVGKAYGAIRGGSDNRNLFVVGPDGKIAFRATPFREIDPLAYTELSAALDKISPPVEQN